MKRHDKPEGPVMEKIMDNGKRRLKQEDVSEAEGLATVSVLPDLNETSDEGAKLKRKADSPTPVVNLGLILEITPGVTVLRIHLRNPLDVATDPNYLRTTT
jgi:hypothetical protein